METRFIVLTFIGLLFVLGIALWLLVFRLLNKPYGDEDFYPLTKEFMSEVVFSKDASALKRLWQRITGFRK